MKQKRALVGLLDRMMLAEARASLALDNDSRYCTVAGRECPECHRVYNMDLPACSWCGARQTLPFSVPQTPANVAPAATDDNTTEAGQDGPKQDS